MLYYLYTSVDICAVALILELQIHTKNRNTYVYTCTNFLEHAQRDREDVRVANECSQNARIFPLFLIRRQTKRKKQHEYSGTPSRVFVFFPKQP